MIALDTSFWTALIILIAAAVLSVVTGKLTRPAGAGAVIVGVAVYAGSGYNGLTMLASFFVMATIATAYKKSWKVKLEGQQKYPEKRKLGQVLANGGIAALIGILACVFPAHKELYSLMLAAALSSATADTLASELGTVFGRNPFNILSWKKEAKGLDGVISIEGTLLGVLGSLVIALVYVAANGKGGGLPIIIIAGTVGNLADSVLGASLERKHYLNNDAVNMLNTLIAALVALIAYGIGG